MISPSPANGPGETDAGRKKSFLRKYGGLIFGLLIICSLLYFLSGADSLHAILRIRPGHLALVIALTLAIHMVVALRWKCILSDFSIADIRWSVLFDNVMLAKLTSHTLSSLFGDVAVRVHGLNRESVSVTGTLVSVAAEKAFEGLLVIALLSGWFSAKFAGHESNQAWWILFSLFLFILASMIPFRLALWWVGLRGAEKGKVISISRGIRPGLTAASLSVFKYILVAGRFLTVFMMLGISLKPVEVFFGTAFAQLGLAVSFTPGGIGFMEAGWAGFLGYSGVDAASIAEFLLVQLVAINLAVVVSTLLFYAFKKVSGWR